MKASKLMLILIFFIYVCGLASASDEQLFSTTENWNFEDWSSGTSDVAPDGWEIDVPSYDSGLFRSNESIVGDYSLGVHGNSSATACGNIYQEWSPSVSAMSFDRIGFWVKCDNVSSDAILQVMFFNGDTYYCNVALEGDETYKYSDNQRHEGWHYYEFDCPDATADWYTRTQIYVTGLETGETVYIDGLCAYHTETNIQTETKNSTIIQNSFSYTPSEVFTNAVCMIHPVNYNIYFLPSSTTTATISGSAHDVEVGRNNIYINTSCLSTSSKNVVVTTTLSEDVTFPTENRIEWKGITWNTTNVNVPISPFSNLFKSKNVWVDSDNKLHLTIQNDSGTWASSQLISNSTHKYGTYTWTVEPPTAQLVMNGVLGLFTYHNNTNEQDIEISRWGAVGEYRELWFSVQPGLKKGHNIGYDLSPYSDETLYCTMIWEPTIVSFSVRTATGSELTWEFTTESEISDVNQSTIMNLWVYNTHPVDYTEQQFVISDYHYSEYVETNSDRFLTYLDKLINIIFKEINL